MSDSITLVGGAGNDTVGATLDSLALGAVGLSRRGGNGGAGSKVGAPGTYVRAVALALASANGAWLASKALTALANTLTGANNAGSYAAPNGLARAVPPLAVAARGAWYALPALYAALAQPLPGAYAAPQRNGIALHGAPLVTALAQAALQWYANDTAAARTALAVSLVALSLPTATALAAAALAIPLPVVPVVGTGRKASK